MRLLITRPAEDAASLARRLEAQGHSVIVEPLLTIEPIAFSLPAGPIAAILLTSRHGARRLGEHAEFINRAGIPVHCVGRATAEAARGAGLARTEEAEGDAAALAAEAERKLDPSAGALVHLRARHTSGAVADTLRRRGFEVHEVIAYEAHAARHLSPATREALGAGEVDGVLLFSPRTARTLARLVLDQGLADALDGKTAYCLSQAVSAALSPLAMQRSIARRPNLDALVDLIGDGAPAKS